jgi:hypothetical protein
MNHSFRKGMQDIPLNDYAISKLKEVEWLVTDDNYLITEPTCVEQRHAQKQFTSDEELFRIMKMGQDHDGFPESIYGYSMTNNLKFKLHSTSAQKVEFGNRVQSMMNNIMLSFNFKTNALFTVYPPGGFISWHNNANAPAYNFIFTWSETGDGWFKYWDMEKKEIVTMQDVPGWQCKAGYFGAEHLFYHAASTNCTRMTVAFTLSRDETSLNWQDDIIEEISSYK